MHPAVERVLAAPTRQQAQAEATKVVYFTERLTYSQAAEMVGTLWVRELLPPEESMVNPVGDNDGFLSRLRDNLVDRWAENHKAAILSEAIDQAVRYLRSEYTRHRFALGMNRANAELALFWHLKRRHYPQQDC